MLRNANYFRLNPYERHKLLINEYLLTNPGAHKLLKRNNSKDKRDLDVIKENHRFLWSDEEGEGQTWGEKLAKKYYDKLFKEYCICDLSRYKENKVALRWRIEQEVVVGKGQFECGNKVCEQKDQLTSWEVNFAYKEHGEKKNALVKLRLCLPCSKKLNYYHKKKEVKPARKRKSSAEGVSEEEESKKRKSEASTAAEGSSKEIVPNKSADIDESQLWKKTENPALVKSRETEFQEYFDDLFM
ncbi:protein FRA10AC1 homolog isoform X2 [Neocloeon triangulifer]|uniref:protein FRA10AC1 homolog isoform X2 n=1 Tax=Neocloeon triangulifer TaxID=2078957 RepID=UPI00286EE8BD|nr:protein FRA10AC1 homolog isoform X2 [Neocloeon triangulifer]